MSAPTPALPVPHRDCGGCPRLVAYREEQRAAEPHWHNAPVPSFGGLDARLLIVGLAPGRRGANRTGRPFTGDFAGDLLYRTLGEFGFARGAYGAEPGDGLSLHDCRITNVVRCVPPQNRPTAAEIAACRGFLAAEIAAMTRLRAILALGGVAHGAVLRTLGLRAGALPFAHGAVHILVGVRDPSGAQDFSVGVRDPSGAQDHSLDDRLRLFDSYHCSRLNTNTGRLTPAMFAGVFAAIRAALALGVARV